MTTVKQLIERLQRFHPGAPVETEDENADHFSIGPIVMDDDKVVIKVRSHDYERNMFKNPPVETEAN